MWLHFCLMMIMCNDNACSFFAWMTPTVSRPQQPEPTLLQEQISQGCHVCHNCNWFLCAFRSLKFGSAGTGTWCWDSKIRKTIESLFWKVIIPMCKSNILSICMSVHLQLNHTQFFCGCWFTKVHRTNQHICSFFLFFVSDHQQLFGSWECVLQCQKSNALTCTVWQVFLSSVKWTERQGPFDLCQMNSENCKMKAKGFDLSGLLNVLRQMLLQHPNLPIIGST